MEPCHIPEMFSSSFEESSKNMIEYVRETISRISQERDKHEDRMLKIIMEQRQEINKLKQEIDELKDLVKLLNEK